MSAFEDEPGHFVTWLKENHRIADYIDEVIPVNEQFVPRFLYKDYLQSLLTSIQADFSSKAKLTLEPNEVIDIIPNKNQLSLVLKNQKEIKVDKVVLALGNNQAASFPFPVSSDVNYIQNPWDYTAPKQIGKHDPVLIVGTGLSMIDVVLTLYHQQHQGNIYAVSRHGLLPLPHADNKVSHFQMRKELSNNLRSLTRYLRLESQRIINEGGDWRSVINALRTYVPMLWAKSTLSDRKRFLRHVLPYWNIHRHRVHKNTADLLAQLCASQQLKILSGRIVDVQHQIAKIKLRHQSDLTEIKVDWVINCMGPSLTMKSPRDSLVHSLLSRGLAKIDVLDLGFVVSSYGVLQEASGNLSPILYTLGPPAKSEAWECSAVPEIRKQSFHLAKHLLNMI